jgi:hypothetical protein
MVSAREDYGGRKLTLILGDVLKVLSYFAGRQPVRAGEKLLRLVLAKRKQGVMA